MHHHHVLDPVVTHMRVKYLGVFLYLGGYLIVVNVGRGKAYHVKHWFSLKWFEVVDIPQDTGADLVFLACIPPYIVSSPRAVLFQTVV